MTSLIAYLAFNINNYNNWQYTKIAFMQCQATSPLYRTTGNCTVRVSAMFLLQLNAKVALAVPVCHYHAIEIARNNTVGVVMDLLMYNKQNNK